LLQAKSRGFPSHKQVVILIHTITNLQTTSGKYSSTYNEDFLKLIFFILSALGAGAAPKALDGVVLPLEGTACFGAAVSGIDIKLGSAEGGICPCVALTDSDDGSTVIEGTSCPYTASSLTTSLTLCFDYLGFRELALKIQEKGRNQSR
jgi:hypothetical protein